MSTLFFNLPRLAILAMLIILIGGLGAVLTLGRQEDPTLTKRYGFVLTALPGADAERVEALISEPLEAELMELPEIDFVASTSRAGISQIRIDLRQDLSPQAVDDAWTLIRAQVEEARPGFPAGASVPEVTQLYVGAATLIVGLTWEGESDPPLAVMRRLALDLEDRFERLPGTEQTETFGLPDEEIRVVVAPEALSAAGLSFRQAAGLVAAADSKVPAGRLRGDGGTIGFEVDGEFESIARIRQVPLLQRSDGSSVRVADVARVEKGFADPLSRMSLENNKRTILVSVFISSGQRVDQWAANARSVVETFAADTPPGLSIKTVFDQSIYTSDRLNGLARNLMFSARSCFLYCSLLWGGGRRLWSERPYR